MQSVICKGPDVKNSSNKGIAKKEIVEDEKAVK
jgi:hypothetical protein